MTVTVRELAELVQGSVLGDAETAITAARPLAEAGAGHITFVETPKYIRALHTCQASAVVAPPDVPANGQVLIRVADPLAAFIAIVRHLHGRPEPPPHGIDPLARIHSTVRMGPDVSLHPFVVVGEGTVIGARCRLHPSVVVGRDCRLGDDVVLHPHVVLYDGTVLGDRVTVHAHAVIGADGFGYRQQNGRHVKVPQLGYVDVGDDVEIGAGSTIDRATFGATRIGVGTKIDNLVQVAHNVTIGRYNLLCSQTGIAGSVKTGDYVIAGGQVGVADHLTIGDGAIIGAQAGVTQNVEAGECLFGTPAYKDRDVKRGLILMRRLPEFRDDLRAIKRRLGMLDG